MKTLVVYYSLTGNVDFVADRIASLLGADLLRLEPVKNYPDKGIKKFFWGGKSAVMGEKPALLPYAFDPAGYGVIVLGSPVWAGTFAPPLRTFLEENREALGGKRLAAFLCSSGGKAAGAFEKLRAEAGIDRFEATADFIDPKDPGNSNKDTRIDNLQAFVDRLSGKKEETE